MRETSGADEFGDVLNAEEKEPATESITIRVPRSIKEMYAFCQDRTNRRMSKRAAKDLAYSIKQVYARLSAAG